jgi:hypothetical protein
MRGVRELKVQKILKSAASSRRNQDLPDAPVIKLDRNDYLPEVKIESLEQKRPISGYQEVRARSVVGRKADLSHILIRQISDDQHLPRDRSGDRSGPRGYNHTIWMLQNVKGFCTRSLETKGLKFH